MKALCPHQTRRLRATPAMLRELTWGESSAVPHWALLKPQGMANFCPSTTQLCRKKPRGCWALSQLSHITRFGITNLALAWIVPLKERLQCSTLHCEDIKHTFLTAKASALFTSVQTASLKYFMLNTAYYNGLKIAWKAGRIYYQNILSLQDSTLLLEQVWHLRALLCRQHAQQKLHRAAPCWHACRCAKCNGQRALRKSLRQLQGTTGALKGSSECNKLMASLPILCFEGLTVRARSTTTGFSNSTSTQMLLSDKRSHPFF